MNLFELTPPAHVRGGYKNRNKKTSRLEDNVVLLSMKGGVKLDSNKTRDRL